MRMSLSIFFVLISSTSIFPLAVGGASVNPTSRGTPIILRNSQPVKALSGVVHFRVYNTSTIQSATHPPVIGYTRWWSDYIGNPLNNIFSSGPMSKTSQTFDWDENLDSKGNPCCKK